MRSLLVLCLAMGLALAAGATFNPNVRAERERSSQGYYSSRDIVSHDLSVMDRSSRAQMRVHTPSLPSHNLFGPPETDNNNIHTQARFIARRAQESPPSISFLPRGNHEQIQTNSLSHSLSQPLSQYQQQDMERERAREREMNVGSMSRFEQGLTKIEPLPSMNLPSVPSVPSFFSAAGQLPPPPGERDYQLHDTMSGVAPSMSDYPTFRQIPNSLSSPLSLSLSLPRQQQYRANNVQFDSSSSTQHQQRQQQQQQRQQAGSFNGVGAMRFRERRMERPVERMRENINQQMNSRRTIPAPPRVPDLPPPPIGIF